MNNVNKVKGLILILVLSLFSVGPSFAESKVGVVDGEKLFDEYPAAQNASKQIADAQESLRTAIEDSEKVFEEFSKQKKSEAEKLTKQKELQAKIDEKAKSTREMIEGLSKKLETDILSAISKVSTQKGLDVVLDKRAVLTGGVDITAEVSSLLKPPIANK